MSYGYRLERFDFSKLRNNWKCFRLQDIDLSTNYNFAPDTFINTQGIKLILNIQPHFSD